MAKTEKECPIDLAERLMNAASTPEYRRNSELQNIALAIRNSMPSMREWQKRVDKKLERIAEAEKAPGKKAA